MTLDPFTEAAPNVLVATSELYTNTTTVVASDDGSCLVIDPALTEAEICGLAAALASRGLRPVAGWSTHPHFDHMLWNPSLGDVPRYATSPAADIAAKHRNDLAADAAEAMPGADVSLVARVTPLTETAIPWDGPAAHVIVHNGHAPGHGAVFLPDSGVLVAGDMLSDIEMPILDPRIPDSALADIDVAARLRDYRIGLSRLASIPGVRHVVPGHGHVGDAGEFERRLAADGAYLDLLERGAPLGDPRISGDAFEFHQAQARYFIAAQ